MRETLMKFISDAVLRTIGGGAEILPSLFAKCIIFAMKKNGKFKRLAPQTVPIYRQQLTHRILCF